MSETKYLTAEEMRYMKEAGLHNEIRRLNRYIMDQDIAAGNLKVDLMRHRLLIMKKEHEEADQSHKAWFTKLKERLEVPEGARFGFDPETGEVSITQPE